MGLGLGLGEPGIGGRGVPNAGEPPGLAGRGGRLPMPGDGDDGAIGRGAGCGLGGVGLTGAAAAGRGAGAAAFGFTAALGLAAALRFAAGFFVADLAAVFRAGAFRADFLAFRADFRAVLLRAVDFLAVLRLAGRRAVFRAVFRVALRAVDFLLVVRFFPVFLVAIALLRCCFDVAHLPVPKTRYIESRFTCGPGLPSHMASQLFFLSIC
ncbi:MAG: hypothetical protein ACSLE4_10155 [Methyloceanibacter sp.]|uniref:hypothetical protein n=1 Tax=Methyloceanibacter sp. TaxID=1965321 RepID=UPI003EE3F56D